MASEASAQTVDRSSRRIVLARALAGLTLAGFATGLVYTLLDAAIRPAGAGDPFGDLMYVAAFAAFPVFGYVLVTRRPENAVGWLMVGMGVFFGLSAIVSSVGWYLLHTGRRDSGLVLLAIDSPSWVPVVVLPITFLLLLFPNGHLPSPRWRWFAWGVGVGLAIVYLAILLDPGPLEAPPVPNVPNPIGIDALGPFLNAAQALILVLPIGVLGSLLSLVLRFRRSSGTERLQLRWLLTAAGFVALLYSGAILASLGSSWGGGGEPGWLLWLQNVVIVSFALIPIAMGVSILRYRLFDIDIVINKAVLFGALAVFIAIVYVAIVAGVGALVGSQANPVLSAAAAAVVALAFQPIRRRAQRVADRLVYGKRATPYEVLSEFSERVGQTYASDELLPRMARALGEGTGAARADVWVRVGEELRSEAIWPEDAGPLPARPIASSEETANTASSLFEPVRHRGELLGALSIEKRPGESLAATEEKLVRDLAAQAGLVMRNAGLTEDLLDTIEQLRTSRQRLVSAQDEERRRLERNLHDGAQQQLVALAVKLRLAEQVADHDPAKVKELLTGLQSDAGDALENLRDLARGIYPPLLADKGLVAALESQARKSTIAIAIEADGVGRYPQEAEAAVYFSCLEALQNVAKYASASRATISLSDGDGRLRFAVKDDGVGFDQSETSYGTGLQGIADRLAALDGMAEVTSVPGGGTTVSGAVPVSRLAS
ncbi:MAG TPA: histidine kinase [Actinomycetota bacterium]|nr:histidine kinase [Actinomycetota bacterium]